MYIYGTAVTEKGIEKHNECMMNERCHCPHYSHYYLFHSLYVTDLPKDWILFQ
jgi:hypothetical protein